MEEIWKDVEEYEGLYQVSNLGRVKRLPYTQVMPINNKVVIFKEKILKQGKSSHKNKEYFQTIVVFSKEGKRSTKIVARLVAYSFVPNPDNKKEVHHINHDPTDNVSSNLKWVTRKEQFDEHLSQEMSNSKRGFVPKNKIKVIVDGVEYSSQSEASLSIGLNKDAIADARRRGRNTVAGKKFIIKGDIVLNND